MRVAAGILLLVGVSQMAGDLLHLDALKGLASATMIAPAPKVFSAVRGFETYSTRFFVEWEGRDGAARSVEITSALYARMRGPYNRRNVYGAALAYGPVMPVELREPVMRAALCNGAPVMRELGVGIDVDAGGHVRVRFEPRPGSDMGTLPRVLVVDCTR